MAAQLSRHRSRTRDRHRSGAARQVDAQAVQREGGADDGRRHPARVQRQLQLRAALAAGAQRLAGRAGAAAAGAAAGAAAAVELRRRASKHDGRHLLLQHVGLGNDKKSQRK